MTPARNKIHFKGGESKELDRGHKTDFARNRGAKHKRISQGIRVVAGKQHRTIERNTFRVERFEAAKVKTHRQTD